MKSNCYFYKMVNRKTGNEFCSNFAWTVETPEEYMKRNSGRVFKCVIITEEEFRMLRKLGK